MKNHKLTFVTLLVLTIMVQLAAAGSQVNYKAAMDNYLEALDSSNEGMVESAIENVIKFKIAVPQQDFSDASEKMEFLSKYGKTNAICYKAFIGQLYLNNPERFNWLNSDSQANSFEKLDKMFANINVHLNK